ncbi:MAG: hypothetical protein U9Q03_00810 [Patescibacteria group bacterium]|nr:hypothetical protein [Patescibacteria group bacterium]
MYISGETARATPVTRLSERKKDLQFIDLITGIQYVKTDGIEAEIRFKTSDDVPELWFRTLRVKLTHMASGRNATGKLNTALILSRSSSGATIKIGSLWSSMGRISGKHFRVEVTTQSGLKKVLLYTPSADTRQPTHSEVSLSDQLAEKPHACTVIDWTTRERRVVA